MKNNPEYHEEREQPKKTVKYINKKEIFNYEPGQRKKKGKQMCLNHALPRNLQECQDRFFESKFKINP